MYREGAIGAILDEYERALEEFKSVISGLGQSMFTAILDSKTTDEDCRSVQTITNHVVRAGYGYANYIRQQYNDPWVERKNNYDLYTPEIACRELDRMFAYTIDTLDNKMDITFEEIMKKIMITRWGQHYDLDQLMEHAIVHILRHRRQIQKLLSQHRA